MFSLTNTKDNFPIATDGKQKIYLNPSIRKSDDIVESDKELELLPSSRGRDVVYAFGASGSGKTHFLRRYAYQYNKMFPKNKVICFSDSGDKEDFRGIKNLKVLPMDLEPADYEMIDPKQMFKNALVIFDDVDSIPDRKRKKAIYKIRNIALTTGRHYDCYMMVTSHIGADGYETKIILNEAHKIILFPNGSPQNEYIATKYGGLKKGQAEEMLDRPIETRWICISKILPRYVLTQYEVIPVS